MSEDVKLMAFWMTYWIAAFMTLGHFVATVVHFNPFYFFASAAWPAWWAGYLGYWLSI